MSDLPDDKELVHLLRSLEPEPPWGQLVQEYTHWGCKEAELFANDPRNATNLPADEPEPPKPDIPEFIRRLLGD